MKSVRKVKLNVRINSNVKSEFKRISDELAFNLSDLVNMAIEHFRQNGEINRVPYQAVVQEIEERTGITMREFWEAQEQEIGSKELNLKMDPSEADKRYQTFKKAFKEYDEFRIGEKVKSWVSEEE